MEFASGKPSDYAITFKVTFITRPGGRLRQCGLIVEESDAPESGSRAVLRRRGAAKPRTSGRPTGTTKASATHPRDSHPRGTLLSNPNGSRNE